MGTWKIEITGTGPHHNSRPDDADKLAQEFVDKLTAAGSTVRAASFSLTYSDGVTEVPAAAGCEGCTDLLKPAAEGSNPPPPPLPKV